MRILFTGFYWTSRIGFQPEKMIRVGQQATLPGYVAFSNRKGKWPGVKRTWLGSMLHQRGSP